MVYKALKNGEVKYVGNNINKSQKINFKEVETSLLENRVSRVKNEKMFLHIANIDNAVFQATVEYFVKLGAKWTNLPLTTLMISSPGEVYAGQKLDYTTDTLPVELPNWFGNDRKIFLSESSQFYLELQLLIKGLDQAFSIYNSFRKEKSDATHLSEFQHIEYEGKVDLEGDIKVFMGLFEHIFNYVVKNNKEDLLFFLSEEELKNKIDLVNKGPMRIGFREALDLLYKETGDEKYKDFSLKNFGTWEEVKLTEVLKSNVIVEKFPMLQIPFYHAIAKEEIDGVPVAKNADFILYGFRETIGAGERIKDKNVLLKKAEIFNLPENDYLPYLQTRDFLDYEVTSGFGMGWQRLTQWITNQPYIYEATVFPRTHLVPNP
ncbi:amino acid--tRNA ligase-related protein [Candidatus Absconditicoccus praedator]|uniref:amino acid--tRNA ligase-related protein n=1 Tax=Candidatus Absconditicoccus praedator TaxID=2735562 RepID=UPI001E3F6311|nr:amino acid--tRNA ligase-related protein [Candidatus Absconditicoccus praedator]UFX83127.1 asparagine--tRNA ligase [Candidatus Absconditicoccus praedator]